MKTPKVLIPVLTLALAVSAASVAWSQPEMDDAVEAVQKSDVASLATWFADGGDINWSTNNDNTLLMIASKVGDLKILQYLFAQNPDVNARNKVGSTALMIAAKYGQAHVVEILLDFGGDPTIRNNRGLTAARFALAYNHDDVYNQLQQAELRVRSNS